MFLRNFKLLIRVLIKQKMFTAISVIGLAVGFAGSLLISAFIWNELSYETIHSKRNNIYRIAVQFGTGDDGMIMAGAMSPLGPAAKTELPEVKDYVRLFNDANVPVKYLDKEIKAKRFFLTDESMLDVFTFNILKQGKRKPLSDISDVMISESFANKLFGKSNPIGKTIEYRGELLNVSGVFADMPVNTQINADVMASYALKEKLFPNNAGWYTFGSEITYLYLDRPIPENELAKKITALIIRNTSARLAGMIKVIPEHLPGIHLNSRALGDLVPHGNKNYVFLFSTIAVFVLLVASLNFINMSTSRSINRAKEVGVKKMLGAARKQLIIQYLAENLFISFLAFILSLVVFEAVFPMLMEYLNINISPGIFKTSEFYLIVFLVFSLTGIISGIYPAFYLTRFNYVQAGKTSGVYLGGAWFRKALVVSQFVISILLIFGTIVIYQQVRFMQNYDIGLNKNNVVLVNYSPDNDSDGIKYETFRNKLLSNSSIINVSGAYSLPGVESIEKQTIRMKGQPETDNKIMRFNSVDYSFINTFKVKLISGRNFSRLYGRDKEESVIINEAAAKELGIKNTTGVQAVIPSSSNQSRLVNVIGIVKDFNLESLQKQIEPVVLYIDPSRFFTVAVKISSEDRNRAMHIIKNTWAELYPGMKYSPVFMDENYKALYSSEEKMSGLFAIFASLAIYIACMGLFGLASFSAEQKRKEIGIRKLLGSRISSIIYLLTREYVKLVFIASAIALPLAFVLMRKWLQEFAYQVSVQWWVFMLSGMAAMIITILTVISRSIKAAQDNPVNSLKCE